MQGYSTEGCTWRTLVVLSVAASVLILPACSGSGDTALSPTVSPEDLQDARAVLTATAEAAHAASVGEAGSIGETREIRFYPGAAQGFVLADTLTMRVTVNLLEMGSPPCGSDDSFLSVCDGSVHPIYVQMLVENPNDLGASIPQATVLDPDGAELTLYICPSSDALSAGVDLPPQTEAAITICFGAENPVSSLEGWSVRVSATVRLPPDGSGEAVWGHD